MTAVLATLGHLGGGSGEHTWKEMVSDGQNEEEEPWHTRSYITKQQTH